MIIVGMDTSSVNATVAVMSDKKLIGEYLVSNDRTHSQIIMPLLEDLLKKCGLKISDADVFATAIGPGSFTGVRIGMASVKTLAQMCEKPVIGISSLESLSYNCSFFDGTICPIIDARHKEVYNALFENGKRLCHDRIIGLDMLLEELGDRKVVFCGDGAVAYRDIIEEKNPGNWQIAPVSVCMQKASSLCQAAYDRAVREDYDNLYSLVPLYLRQSQAERELAQKQNKMVSDLK